MFCWLLPRSKSLFSQNQNNGTGSTQNARISEISAMTKNLPSEIKPIAASVGRRSDCFRSSIYGMSFDSTRC